MSICVYCFTRQRIKPFIIYYRWKKCVKCVNVCFCVWLDPMGYITCPLHSLGCPLPWQIWSWRKPEKWPGEPGEVREIFLSIKVETLIFIHFVIIVSLLVWLSWYFNYFICQLSKFENTINFLKSFPNKMFWLWHLIYTINLVFSIIDSSTFYHCDIWALKLLQISAHLHILKLVQHKLPIVWSIKTLSISFLCVISKLQNNLVYK